MIKEIYKKLAEEEDFSKDGLEMSEALFLLAKSGQGFLTPGRDNGVINVWGKIENMPEEDMKRLNELGWSHPQAEEEEWRENAEEYWAEQDENDEVYWSYTCM